MDTEHEAPPFLRRKWLAFLGCGAAAELPLLPPPTTSTATSSASDIPRAFVEQYGRHDTNNEVCVSNHVPRITLLWPNECGNAGVYFRGFGVGPALTVVWYVGSFVRHGVQCGPANNKHLRTTSSLRFLLGRHLRTTLSIGCYIGFSAEFTTEPCFLTQFS